MLTFPLVDLNLVLTAFLGQSGIDSCIILPNSCFNKLYIIPWYGAHNHICRKAMTPIYTCPCFPFLMKQYRISITYLSQQLLHVCIHSLYTFFTACIFSLTSLLPLCTSNFFVNISRGSLDITSKSTEGITVILTAFHVSAIAILTRKVISIVMMDGRKNGMRLSRRIS